MGMKYKDKSYTVEERVDDLIGRMTLEEKIGQMMQISFISVSTEEAEEWITRRCAGSFLHALGDDAKRLQEIAMNTRLGIPLLFGIDAVRGHALHNGATIFPTQLGMACTWNPELVKKQAGSLRKRWLPTGCTGHSRPSSAWEGISDGEG